MLLHRIRLNLRRKMRCDSAYPHATLLWHCRVFALIENSVHQHTRGSDSASAENLNREEAMLDVCLLSTTNSIMQQCSLPIYTVCRYWLCAELFVHYSVLFICNSVWILTLCCCCRKRCIVYTNSRASQYSRSKSRDVSQPTLYALLSKSDLKSLSRCFCHISVTASFTALQVQWRLCYLTWLLTLCTSCVITSHPCSALSSGKQFDWQLLLVAWSVWLTGEELSKEEHVDNEFLWNLKLLSEVISCSLVMVHLKLGLFTPGRASSDRSLQWRDAFQM